jgi:hypothetical protein
MTLAAEKVLSRNDLGLTGTHQAGILVPKRQEILDVFPKLDLQTANPTMFFSATDPSGKTWRLAFKYYNSRPRGTGTRDEFRITRLTSLLREAGLTVGDALIFSRDGPVWRVTWKKRAEDDKVVLDLSVGGWVSIKL